jgi:hypothetical protein
MKFISSFNSFMDIMNRHCYRRFVTLFLFVFALQAAASRVNGQVRPGGVRVPGTTVAREAPLLNWTAVTQSEFTLGGGQPGSYEPFRLLSLETVEGSPRWVVRSYHWDTSKGLVLDGTEVYPTGSRMVHAVTGYSKQLVGGSSGGWHHSYPNVTIAILVPIATAQGSSGARRVGPLNTRANPAALYNIPLGQAIGYQRVAPTASARAANPGKCSLSTAYTSNGPPLQASCVLLEPGQSVDLPNQIRILRVGDNYRIIVGGSLVEDLPSVTIVHAEGRYYTLHILRS